MRVGLAIPCYIDAFFPEVGIAVLELLERFGVEVGYPMDQTCCGQPMANSGCNVDAKGAEQLFVQNFQQFDHIVMPSGSCVHHIRNKFDALEQTEAVKHVRANTFEFCEFLTDVLKVDEFPWAEFPHKVGLHTSCSTLRGLNEASISEVAGPGIAVFSKPLSLLSKVRGIEMVKPKRPDECCGFGGTFSITEPAVSAKMGFDKVSDHCNAGAEYIVSMDSSCTLHQKGCAERNKVPVKFIHIAQILNGARA